MPRKQKKKPGRPKGSYKPIKKSTPLRRYWRDQKRKQARKRRRKK